MITEKELVGLKFNGVFQKRAERIEEFRQWREEVRREQGEERLAQFDREFGSSETSLGPANSPNNFELLIMAYDPITGLFQARANDHYGDSVMAGNLKENEIKFMKIYEDKRQIEYEGNIWRMRKDTTCFYGEGKYFMHRTHISDEHNGTWSMKSIQRR
jgi:hypothetical protein